MGNAAQIAAELVAPKLKELGLELWDAEFKKEGSEYFLRLYINRPDGDVGIEDCEAVDAYVSPLLDEADPIEQSYYFEVSSAGLIRTLSQDWHYDRYLGREVEVSTYKAENGMPKKCKAILDGYDDTNVRFLYKDAPVSLSKNNITKIIIDLI